MDQSNKKWVIVMPLIMAALLASGIYIGNRMRVDGGEGNFLIYPQTNKLSSIINYIQEEYVDTISKDKLIEDAIPLILADLDPHSVYIPARDLKETNENLQGNFDGIGVEFNIQNDTVIVLNTIAGGPSEKVGILPGDRIVMVDDSIIAGIGISNDGVMKVLKGKKGTIVKVGIFRKSVAEVLSFDIARDKIPYYSVDVAYMIDDRTGYIKMSRFSRNTYDEFITAVHKLKIEGMENVIIDLRGNSGGYLEIATKIIDEFLEAGKIMVYTQGQARPKKELLSSSKGLCIDNNVIVLIDESSASASEILAGAIQDNDRGLIVGRRSFGKGLVQEQTQFPDGSALRLTVARYYTPTGRCIQKPYNNGSIDYYHEINERYYNGEFMDADSIHFSDSLKYTTPGGKVVYGGGGIMPDVFVPVDTSGISDYFTDVRNKGLIYKFAFKYADDNRQFLNKFSNYSDLLKYLEKNNILSVFVKFAQKEGVKPVASEIEYSRENLNVLLMAHISRNIFDDEGFYPIISKIDNALNKAVELIEK